MARDDFNPCFARTAPMLANNHTHKNVFSSQIFTNTRNEIVHGGYITALIAPSLVLTTSLLTGAGISIPILIITYLIPLVVYSFDYYKDMDSDQETNQDRAAYFKAKSKIYPYIMGSYLLMLTILVIFFTNWQMISFISFLILVSLTYPLGLKKLTKLIPAFKNMFTIFVWALAGTFSLAVFNSLEISVAYLLLFLFFYLKMISNTIFFDMKDVRSDAKDNLKTVPVILGKKKTLKLMHILNTGAFIPLFIGIWMGVFPLYAISMVIILFYCIYYLNTAFKSSDKEIKPRFFILADIEFILWPLILFTGKFLFF